MLSLKFPQLFVSERLFIAWFAVKRQTVHWILRFFFMEYVILTVLPIRECGLIGTLICVGWLLLGQSCSLFLLLLNHKLFECVSISCWLFHTMRVDNLGLFLKVKCLLVGLYSSILKFLGIVLLIIWVKLRVWVSHKSVSASSLSGAFITCR